MLIGKDVVTEYSLLPLLSSLSIFAMLYGVKLRDSLSSTLLKIAGDSCLFVYIIQENPFGREFFWSFIGVNNYLYSSNLIFRWLLSLIFMFGGSYIMYLIYNYLHRKILASVEERISSQIGRLIERFC